MKSLISRVVSRLRHAPDPANEEKLRAAVAEQRQRALQWRAKAGAQSRRIEELNGCIEEREARIRELRDELDRRRRSAPRPSVLRYPLHARRDRLPLLSHDREAARWREERLLAASPAYAAAVAAAAAPTPGLERTALEGLAWWVPTDSRMPQRMDRAARQGLPLRAILQTRELAIGGVMLDLGANIGRTSIPRVILGDVRAVYAAEPDPGNYACLVRNVVEHRLQGFVLPDQIAVGATRGEVHLRRSKYIGGHRVLQGPDAAAATGDVIPVAMWPVDAWIEHLGIEPGAVTFVKVDVQGSEVGVLRGAQSLLAQPQVVWLMEVDPSLLKSAGTSTNELLGLLQQHFTHFIDIGTTDPGDRVQTTATLGESLGYLGPDHGKTDLLLFKEVS